MMVAGTSQSNLRWKGNPMTPSNNRVSGKNGTRRIPLDLYEAGDQLAPQYLSDSERIGQTATHSDRTLPDDYSKVVASGWRKPSIQIGALLYLRSRGELPLHGHRRLSKLLNTISYLEIAAAQRHEERISKSPESFGVLLRWVCRPLHLRSFRRAEKRRIGVGYRDKGSLPPSHSSHRVFGEQGLLYLGEEKEFLPSIQPLIARLAGCQNGALLFHHVSDGWWRVLSPYERFVNAQRMLTLTLAKY